MTCKTILLKKGPGIPLVFLHGFLGNSADWESVCSYLPPCHCIGVDLPGHGSSPFSPTFEFDPPAPKFHLIGYSMGGRLAMQYALRFPERIAQLIIASAHPGLLSVVEKEKRKESDAEWARLLLELPIDEFLRRWYDQPLFKNYKPDFSMRRKQNIPDLAEALVHFSLANQLILHVKNAIHIVGEKDTKFRALNPEAIIVLESGHVIHLEKPESFAQLIAEKIL
jgi:2-succinyl-6-hydroxy-2,4-cyclohexadiene-1-carboxylate synthase